MLRTILRTALGVVLGLLVGLLIILAVEGVGHTIFPPPPGVNLTDPAQLATVMAKIPTPAKFGVLLAWFLGTLGGAAVGNLIAGRRPWAGRIVTLLVLALSIFNMSDIPHPAWMAVSAVVLILFGGFVADRAFGQPRPR
ncbi:MAG: hypothetical protein C0481_17585 [Phenylobacterium sp.]|uniref:hypothetical protein n=1 Tax=Phenylobacterium sp. TaxID=1871053 RepID=UPI0025EAD2FE|nr:hypothetical protein [Phenylobacterium sp.]MBA4013676.1 hypothetical protein [Phenylobacterium sp.]